MKNLRLESFFDTATSTLSYIVWDAQSRDALIIDPVLDFEPANSEIRFESATLLKRYVDAHELNVHWILETHAHADHLTSAQMLKTWWPEANTGIGGGIVEVQKTFKKIFALSDADCPGDGRQFDRLFRDGERHSSGSFEFKVLSTPGHTPACVTYIIQDMAFTGDALFMPDLGTGRCDFPQGSARTLYHSVHEKLYNLSDSTRIFVGHDYPPQSRSVRFETSVREEKKANVQLKSETSSNEFVQLREARDRTLKEPRLLYPSLFLNINGGKLPAPNEDGQLILRVPSRANV